MKIRRIRADWLHVPIPEDRQHSTDFGRFCRTYSSSANRGSPAA